MSPDGSTIIRTEWQQIDVDPVPDAGEYSYLSCPVFLGSLSY
jgi:hypothetical protein